MSKPAKKARTKQSSARILKGAGLALVIALALLAYAGGLLRPVDDGFSQLRFQLLKRPASHDLTLLEIDVPSLRAAGAWPWSRARFARAIDNLTKAGAELVVFDVDFSAPSTPAADEAMAASIARQPGRVVLPTFMQPVLKDGAPVMEETSPLAALAKNAVLASVNVPTDSDGRVRSYRYGFATPEGERQTVAATLAGTPPRGAGSFLVDYGIRLGDIDRLSFEAAYTGRFDPTLVRGRKILVGATALELGDEFATPMRGVMSGVYIHALAYESLHAGRDLQRLPLPIVFLLVGAAAVVLAPVSGAPLGAMLRRHAIAAGLILVAPIVVQAAAPVSIDPSPLILAQGLCLAWLTRWELQRRAQALVEAREQSLLQLAIHMRRSRQRLRAANRKLEASNEALDKALKARTEFLATTSHEIRTPLNAILGVTQVILADRTVAEPLKEKVELVQGSGQAMLALVDDILDVAKIETGALVISPAEMDLHKLLRDAAQLWSEKAGAKGLRLHIDTADVPGRIVEDQTRLRQVVFNLMSNAIKFTEAGEVALRAHVEAGDGGEVLAIEVRDSGIGIPAEKLEEIFEPFRQVDSGVTRKYEGTGLGLAICRQLARGMGGELSVTSVLGEGSTFAVRLPLRRAAPAIAPVDPPGTVAATGLAGASLLLVEGNPLAQSVLRTALGPHVAGIQVAGTIEAALTALGARGFDLVLAEGRTLAAGDAAAIDLAPLVAAAGGARVSILWGGAPEDVPSLLEGGAHQVVIKPISTADLTAELQSLLSTAAADGADAQPMRVAV